MELSAFTAYCHRHGTHATSMLPCLLDAFDAEPFRSEPAGRSCAVGSALS